MEDWLKSHPLWRHESDGLHATFVFKDFVCAWAFMNAVALEAEKCDHHPDWTNSYNVVKITLLTHSEKRVTQKDFDLAEAIERYAALFSYAGGKEIRD